MAYSVKASPTAESDISSAYSYLAERAPEAATRWLRLMRTVAASLKEMPGRCPIAPETTGMGVEFRHLLFGRYRIIFKILEEEKIVYIVTVRHGARRKLTDEGIAQLLKLP